MQLLSVVCVENVAPGYSLCFVLTYALVSLYAKIAPDFDMDKMLHRGKYAPELDIPKQQGSRLWLWKALAIGDEFIVSATRWFILLGRDGFFPSVGLLSLFPGALFSRPLPKITFWISWWMLQAISLIIVSLVVMLWFICGGVIDLR